MFYTNVSVPSFFLICRITYRYPYPYLCTIAFGKSCDYSSKARKGDDIADGDVEDGLNVEKNIAVDGLSPLISVAEDGNHVLEDVQSKDGDESMETRLSNDDVCQAETPTERYSFLSEASIAELEEKISRLERAHTELKTARLSLS